MADTIAAAAYEIAQGALDGQERRAADLRTRSGMVLAAASIAGSFLGAKTAHGNLDTLAVLAVIAYVCCVASVLVVLVQHRFILDVRATVFLQTAKSSTATLEAMQEAMVGWLDNFYETNRDTLDLMSRWYTAAVAFLGAEVLLWTLSLAG